MRLKLVQRFHRSLSSFLALTRILAEVCVPLDIYEQHYLYLAYRHLSVKFCVSSASKGKVVRVHTDRLGNLVACN